MAPASTCICTCWRQTFRAYDWYKDDVNYYISDDFWDNSCQSFLYPFNNSLKCICKLCVDGSICHFKFLKVVTAQILGKEGIFCIVLLSVCSQACLPIFIEIVSYITDTEPKISWHISMRNGVLLAWKESSIKHVSMHVASTELLQLLDLWKRLFICHPPFRQLKCTENYIILLDLREMNRHFHCGLHY